MSDRDAQVTSGPGLDAFRGVSRLERAVLPFLREPTLWPVFLVMLAHVLLVLAPLLVLAFRDAHAGSITALVVFSAASVFGIRLEVRDRGRPGLLAILVFTIWAISGACAWACARLGLV